MLKDAQEHHAWYEDLQALVIGVFMISLGIVIYAKASLLTGGLAGLALLIEFLGWTDFGLAFFVMNLPFYILAVIRLGWNFAIRSVISVTMLSAMARYLPNWIEISNVHPAYAAILGGVLIGMGMLVLLRHKFGVGGTNMLAHFLQERNIMRAGYVQLIIDLSILAAAIFLLPPSRVAWSVLGAVVLNMVLALNHRPGRYRGFS